MLDKMFNHISEKNVMITPYTVCLKAYLNYPTPHYYDTLALISKDGLTFKNTINTCLFPECSRCIIHRKNYKVNIDKKDMINDNISEVQCAFAGFVLMKTDIYIGHLDRGEEFAFFDYMRARGFAVNEVYMKYLQGEEGIATNYSPNLHVYKGYKV